MASNWRKHLEGYLKGIEVSSKRVLDIGGSQLPVSSRIFLDNCEYTILDLLQPHETKRKPDIEVDIQDFFGVLGKTQGKTYQTVFCLEVSEYWHDPMNAFKAISEIMAKGGTLYISFHWLYPIHKPEKQDFLRYSVSGAKKLLELNGFKVEDVSEYMIEDTDSYQRFVGGGKYRPDWDNPDAWVSDFIIRATKI